MHNVAGIVSARQQTEYGRHSAPNFSVGASSSGSVIRLRKLRSLCSGSRSRRAKETAAAGGGGARGQRSRAAHVPIANPHIS